MAAMARLSLLLAAVAALGGVLYLTFSCGYYSGINASPVRAEAGTQAPSGDEALQSAKEASGRADLPADYDHFVTRQHVSQRVVVCVSSFPGRIQKADRMLKSIIEGQTFGAPDQVYISVPREVKRIKAEEIEKYTQGQNVTAFLEDMVRWYSPVLKIIETEDFGPSTKLLGCLPHEPHPDTLIITVDDDVAYDPWTLSYLTGVLHHRGPRSSAAFVCETYNAESNNWGWRMAFGRFGDGRYNDAENKEDRGKYFGECKGFTAAFGGAGYRRSFFAADLSTDPIYNYTGVPDGCKIHDDVYISGRLMERGIMRFVPKLPKKVAYPHHGDFNSLSIHNVQDVRPLQEACVKHFNMFKQDAPAAATQTARHMRVRHAMRR